MVEKKIDSISKNIKNRSQIESEHEWDGITEYMNPDPIWLRGLFYITVFFSLGYWIFFPSWPTPHDEGVLSWSSIKELQQELHDIAKAREEYQGAFDKASFDEILKDQKLLKFAISSGKSTFQNNCAVCHGAGGGGNPGYPNLTAGAWLWGGKIDDIYTTLKHGIRSTDPDTHDSQMPAFGRDKMISDEEISLMAHYVIYLAQPPIMNKNNNDITDKPSFDLDKADKIFQTNCASCHGTDGKGNYIVGAPNLIDAIWLYGSDYDTVHDVIYNGRDGVMPYWEGKLSDTTIRAVAVYVHQLGGGE
jgi:cytochrome c oxidase cbb3-type subunit 3